MLPDWTWGFEAFLLNCDEFFDEVGVGIVALEGVCVEEVVEYATDDDVSLSGIADQ